MAMETAPRRAHGSRLCGAARTVGRAVAMLAVAAGVVLVARTVDGRALWRVFAEVSVPLVLAAGALHFVTLGWKAEYWRATIAPVAKVPLRAMLRYEIVCATASALFPARAGDVLRVVVLHRERGVPLRYGGSIAAMEKGADVLSLMLVAAPIPWLLHASGLEVPPWVRRATQLVALFALAAMVLASIAALVPSVRSLLHFPAVSRPSRLVGRALGAVVLSWATDLVEIALVLAAVGLHASPGAACLVLLSIAVAICVPVAPGHAGSLELGAIAALDVLGAPRDRAIAFALLYHAMQIVPVVVAGLWMGRGLLSSSARLEVDRLGRGRVAIAGAEPTHPR
jgi:uncharacterized membrane protein YbhN (UPF0104 family)